MANVLCGHILASRKSVPWLYVLPIFAILEEAKDITSCQDINLPQQDTRFDSFALPSSCVAPCGQGPTIASASTSRIEYEQNEVPVACQQWVQRFELKKIFHACLGSLSVWRAGLPRLDYTAFRDHCRSRLKEYETATYGPHQNAEFCNTDLFDILQMIRTGLHRHELVDTWEQRAGPGLKPPFAQERIDRVASLLVMTEIGNMTRYGCGARAS